MLASTRIEKQRETDTLNIHDANSMYSQYSKYHKRIGKRETDIYAHVRASDCSWSPRSKECR
jgi:hypothetical protein